MSIKPRYTLVNFIYDETGEVFETARIPLKLWNRFKKKADALGVAPEALLKTLFVQLGKEDARPHELRVELHPLLAKRSKVAAKLAGTTPETLASMGLNRACEEILSTGQIVVKGSKKEVA